MALSLGLLLGSALKTESRAQSMQSKESDPEEAIKPIYNDHQRFIKRKMPILGGWAIANITVGAIRASRTSGSLSHFHEGNALWNTVNLGIAAVGYYNAHKQLKEESDKTVREQAMEVRQLDKVLWINAGLDVGYMAGGLVLNDYGIRNNRARWEGYGKALVLQGAFLLLYDAYLILSHRELSGRAKRVLSSISVGPNRVALRWPIE